MKRPRIGQHLAALSIGAALTLSSQAADPVAFSDTALTKPTVVDFGELSEDTTYVFFFNAVKAGASTAVAGNATWRLKLEQWTDTVTFGTTEFGVVDLLPPLSIQTSLGSPPSWRRAGS